MSLELQVIKKEKVRVSFQGFPPIFLTKMMPYSLGIYLFITRSPCQVLILAMGLAF